MSDNSFQAFYEELKLLVEKFEKKQMKIKKEYTTKKQKNLLKMQELMLCIIDVCWQNIDGYHNV